MTPYALQFVRAEELAIFNKVRDVVTRLPDVDLGIDIVDKKPIILSCHILARAIAKNFPLKVNSGYFARSYNAVTVSRTLQSSHRDRSMIAAAANSGRSNSGCNATHSRSREMARPHSQ